MKRKIVATAVILSFFVVPTAVAFTDTGHHDNEEAIDYLYQEGAIEGYDDGTYLPDASINRAEFVKILVEAKYPGEAEGSRCFPDVRTEWYATYVCEAEDRGIVQGYSDDTFKPGNDINLAEALKVVLETYEVEVCTSCYDVWYEPYYEKAQDLGLLDGVYQNISHPITRGEMAQLVYNTVQYLKAEGTEGDDDDATPISEVRTYDEDDYNIYEVTGDELPYHTPGTIEDYTVIAVERDDVRVYVPEGYEVLGMANVEDLRTCEPLLSGFLGIPFPKDDIVLEIYIPTDGVSRGYSGSGILHYARPQTLIDMDLEAVLDGEPDGFLFESGPSYCANTHELTHAFLYDTPLPSWGDEGLAEYAQSVNQGDAKDYLSCRSTGYYRSDEWFDYVDLSGAGSEGITFYDTADCFFQNLVNDYGAADFQAIIQGLNEYHTGEAAMTQYESYHFVNDVLFPTLGTDFAETLEIFGITEEDDYAPREEHDI